MQERIRVEQAVDAVTKDEPRPATGRKLTVGAVDDPAEREADRIADAALGTPVARLPMRSGTRIRRRLEVGPEGGDLDDHTAGAIANEASRAAPMAEPVRGRIESAFGADFSRVRIHEDSDVAPRIGASAFTQGNVIHFAAGQYNPGTDAGQRVLAHELAHVVQGGAAPTRRLHRLPAQPIVRRMWTLEMFDDKIPPDEGWKIRKMIRSQIKSYFDLVDRYPTSFAASGDADAYLATELKKVDEIFKQISTFVQQYRKVLESSKDSTSSSSSSSKGGGPSASPDRKLIDKRINGLIALTRAIDLGNADVELRQRHHDAVMGRLVKETRESTIGSKQGKAQAGAAEGGVNTLGYGEFKIGARTVTGYTKADRPVVSDPGREAGITEDQAKMSLRSVATFKVSELLKLGLIPETVLMRDGAKTGQFMAEATGSAGQGRPTGDQFSPKDPDTVARVDKLLKQIAKPGITAEDKKSIKEQMADLALTSDVTVIDGKIYKLDQVVAADFDWWDPVIQRDLNALEFFDLLVGHADRHAGNYIVDYERDVAKNVSKIKSVKGIDNDDTWGSAMTPDKFGDKNFMKTPLPQLVDVRTAIKFLVATWTSIEQILKQFSMSALEIAAAKDRFDAVRAHIRKLATSGKLVSRDGQLDPADVHALEKLGISTAALAPLLKWGSQTWNVSTSQDSLAKFQDERRVTAAKNRQKPYAPWKQ